MSILLTRSIQDSLGTAKELQEYNIKSFIEAFSSIEWLPCQKKANSYKNIVITSKNASQALNDVKPDDARKIFVVGEKTAKFIPESLRRNLIIASGNVDSLASMIRNHIKEEEMFYPRGEVVSADLKKILAGSNINVIEEIVYRVKYKKDISEKLQNMLTSNQIKAAIFFSQEALDNFLTIDFVATKKSVLKTNFIVPLNCDVVAEIKDRVKRFRVGDIRSLISQLGT